ncbi:L-threonylcarbamoyladenylate synthase [Thermodesulfobacteriota bacterium]
MPVCYKTDAACPHPALLKEAASRLVDGKIIIYPTETIYGIGAIYNDVAAIEKIFSVKARDASKPLLLLINEISMLFSIAKNVTPEALAAARTFWPGPLTLLFIASPSLPSALTGNSGKIGCRISSHPVALGLVQHINKPITSTSANLSGEQPAGSVSDIPETLQHSVDIILDSGKTPGGMPSTVLDVSEMPFRIVREGAVSADSLARELGEKLIK